MSTRSDTAVSTLREPTSCTRSRLSDLNKDWIDQVLSVSIDCNRSRYIMKVFLLFFYQRRYCDLKYKSEIFIKKKLRNVVVVVVAATGIMFFWNFWREANVALAMHSHTWSASVASATKVLHILHSTLYRDYKLKLLFFTVTWSQRSWISVIVAKAILYIILGSGYLKYW